MTTITPAMKLTALKHLTTGKSTEIVATIMGNTTASDIVGFARNHGYPDVETMKRAVDILEKKLEQEEGEETLSRGLPSAGVATAPRTTSSPVTPGTLPPKRPEELRTLINTGKGHPSRRIQAATDRLIDQVNRLKDMIHEDAEKHAEKRRLTAQREAARAEVKRLEQQLADAKAALRGPKPTSAPATDGPTAAVIRKWAASAGINCPKTGRIPDLVRAAYDDAIEQVAS